MQRLAARVARDRVSRMSFLFKSALCLAIVFSCMEWPQGERPQTVARAVAQDMSHRAQRVALEKAASLCLDAPLDCVNAADGAGAVGPKLSTVRAQARRAN